MSRRRFLAGAAGGAGVGVLAGAGATYALAGERDQHRLAREPAAQSDAAATPGGSRTEVDLDTQVAFYDQSHPAGIQTPQQRYTVFMTFDLATTAQTADLQVLLARWTAAIGLMMQGQPVGQVDPTRPDAVPQDTGEAAGLQPASLTVTVGLGPGVFGERFGLAAKKPAAFKPIPALPGDALNPALSGGDLSVQACADDPQVAYHAVRNLARMVTTTAHTRWVVLGFGRASAGAGQETPRNLMGFKDGTRNIKDDKDFGDFVWVNEPGWMQGGSYQVVRKIRMLIENWDGDRIADQEATFGRTKQDGGPLSGGGEFETPDFAKQTAGKPAISPLSHVALAAPENNDGLKILRRSFNYTDGLNQYGLLDAGLLFVAYMNDPAHFTRLQSKLGKSDLLNEYIQHIGSGVFAVPAPPKSGGYLGQALFT